MNMEQIENRIKQLIAERSNLEAAHNALVQQNQKSNQEFQQAAVQNQSRYAQLTGAITELQKLTQNPNQEGNTHHDNLSTTTNLDNRVAHVRHGIKSESR